MTAKTRRFAWAHLAVLLPLSTLLPLAARAQTLEIATDQSPVGLDPHVATAFSTLLIDSNIYEGLTAIDKDLRTVPCARRILDGCRRTGCSYLFKLRPGAKFHNGRAVTAQDVDRQHRAGARSQDRLALASRFTGISKMEAVGATMCG